MYGSWTEIAVLLRNYLGFIWELPDVFTVHICLAKNIHLGGMILRISLMKMIQNDEEKCNKISTEN